MFSLVEELAKEAHFPLPILAFILTLMLYSSSLIQSLMRPQCKPGHLDYFDVKKKHQKSAYSAEQVRIQKILVEGRKAFRKKKHI